MSECKCFHWSRISDTSPTKPGTFSLPASLPNWPPGLGFASGRIRLGEIEVLRISQFEFIWSSDLLDDNKKGVSFYKPMGVPDGFYILGHYCQSNKQPLRGFLLVAREVASHEPKATNTFPTATSPPLQRPLDYTLVWSSEDGSHGNFEGAFFWLPQPPEGYKSIGFLVTTRPERPDLDEVRCIRADLTDECQVYCLMLHAYSRFSNFPFRIWSIRPSHRGMLGRGVSVGTFFCSSYLTTAEPLNIACLRNFDSELHAMPNLDQVHSLINHYGPTVFFHPDEIYLPSSVSWFFSNGALFYKTDDLTGQTIDATGSNLPGGGRNDGQFWIDLPSDDRRDTVKCGNLESAKLYIHVKPAIGGTFTDIAMWVFCPFNGPATFKAGPVNISLGKIGQHVGDWEHFTLRICNFTGELWSIYFSQHSSGQWIDAYDLEYIEGNKAIVYSSKSGHASYPHPGTYLQGSSKLGIGIRNDACKSNLLVNSSKSYELVAAEYLGVDIEPGWLQFMREWGPTIVYSSRTELDRIIKGLPLMLRYSVENMFNKFPLELYGEEGPTGPKEKNNWVGDERG